MWKVAERLVGAFFGSKRVVPSDDRTRGDVLHSYLYIEVKAYKRAGIFTLYNDTEVKAKVEGKVPVVCMKQPKSTNFLVICKGSDLEAVYLAYRERVNHERLGT